MTATNEKFKACKREMENLCEEKSHTYFLDEETVA